MHLARESAMVLDTIFSYLPLFQVRQSIPSCLQLSKGKYGPGILKVTNTQVYSRIFYAYMKIVTGFESNAIH